jgi:hypothetical protein
MRHEEPDPNSRFAMSDDLSVRQGFDQEAELYDRVRPRYP